MFVDFPSCKSGKSDPLFSKNVLYVRNQMSTDQSMMSAKPTSLDALDGVVVAIHSPKIATVFFVFGQDLARFIYLRRYVKSH